MDGSISRSEGKADVVIALPVFNGAEFIEAAVRSALTQSLPPREVVVFDNCSTDGTVAIARRLLPHQCVREAAMNAGAVANFNRAVRETQSEYFIWLGSDDRLLPDYLAKSLAALEHNPAAPAALPGVRFVDPDGQRLREQTFVRLGSPVVRERLRAFLRQPRWTEVYAVYRRDALEASPGFRQEFAADVLLTWWFLLRERLAVVDEVLWEYREYPDKTVAQMAQSLSPLARSEQWRKVRLWFRLRAETQSVGIPREVARAARVELWLALSHHTWWMHFAEDLLLWLESRSPTMAAWFRRIVRRTMHNRRRRRSPI